MGLPTLSKYMLIIAAIFSIGTIGIWAVFLRQVAVEQATGIVKTKTFKPAGTYLQQQVGAQRGFRTATPIPIAESYIFEIAVDGWTEGVRTALNTVASGQYQIGDRVSIKYSKRGIPFIWSRVYVLDMNKVQ